MSRKYRNGNRFGDDTPPLAQTVAVPSSPSDAGPLSQAADKAGAQGAHPAIAAVLANAASVAAGGAPVAAVPSGAQAASALAQAAMAASGDHPAVTQALANGAIVANGGSAANVPAIAPPASATPALVDAATKALTDDAHPAVVAALQNAASASQGAPPIATTPKGPEAAKALSDAAKDASGDHPAVVAALTNAASEAKGQTPVPVVLANAAGDKLAEGAHPAVVAALANAAAVSAGGSPPAAPPTGGAAASALADAAKKSEAVGDHPAVTATLAKAAVAAVPSSKDDDGKLGGVATLAAAAKSAGASPAAAEMLAKAAASNVLGGDGNSKPPMGTPSGGVPGDPSSAPSPPPAAYAAGAPASPATPPPAPPALAALPDHEIAAVQTNVLQTLTPHHATDLQSGDSLPRGGFIASHASHDGVPRWKLILQHDGDLVLYHGASPIWAAGTAGSGADSLVMVEDGNLVLLGPDGRHVWSTGTRSPGAFAVLQDDGNLVIYDGFTALWASSLDSRTRGQNLHRVANVFLGGVRHHGHNGHHFQFGAERMDHLFRRLGQVTAQAIPRSHRRGFDLAMVASTGRYSPVELRNVMADYSANDRAGFAAGVALKQGVAHPHFARHAAGGGGFGWEWPWAGWFGRHGGMAGGHGRAPRQLGMGGGRMAPPPPPLPPGMAPLPPQNAALAGTLAIQPPSPPLPPPPQDPAQPSPSGATIGDPFLLPDGSNPSLPPDGFHDWNSRRAWEEDQRRGWQHAHGLQPTGQPGLNDPFLLGDGTAVPLPGGGFRDWNSRQSWELQQRNAWQLRGGHHPLALPPGHPEITHPASLLARARGAIGRGRFYGEEFGVDRPSAPTGRYAPGVIPPPEPVMNLIPRQPPPPPLTPPAAQPWIQRGSFNAFDDATLGQVAFDAAQADEDAAAGITPPPMVSADGQFIPAAATARDFQSYSPPTHLDPRHRGFHMPRFWGDAAPSPAPLPSNQDAAALQLAGAAIGLGAQNMAASDKSAAIKVASGHPHTLAGLVGVGAGNALHKIEAWFHTMIYPSKKNADGTTTIAPINIEG
jgi:hypothetical protein